jgi:uncharacterized membrane protein
MPIFYKDITLYILFVLLYVTINLYVELLNFIGNQNEGWNFILDWRRHLIIDILIYENLRLCEFVIIMWTIMILQKKNSSRNNSRKVNKQLEERDANQLKENVSLIVFFISCLCLLHASNFPLFPSSNSVTSFYQSYSTPFPLQVLLVLSIISSFFVNFQLT